MFDVWPGLGHHSQVFFFTKGYIVIDVHFANLDYSCVISFLVIKKMLSK